MTTFEGSHDGKGMRVGIVCSRFNEFIVTALLDGAKRGLSAHGVSESDVDVVWVPGAFEIPIATKAMATSGRYDTLVTLGAVIRGETAHFEYVADHKFFPILLVFNHLPFSTRWKTRASAASQPAFIDFIDHLLRRHGFKTFSK